MSRESLVFVLGLIVFFTPFSGFPGNWEKVIFITAGAILMFVGYSLRRTAFFRSIDSGNGEGVSDEFVESREIVEETEEHEHDKKI